jgi:hypothetical protein
MLAAWTEDSVSSSCFHTEKFYNWSDFLCVATRGE